MRQVTAEEAVTVRGLRQWLIDHLRDDHGVHAKVEPMGDEPFVPDSFADLKAAHDLVHSFTED